MRIITGGMRTTPIAAMEKATDLQSLEERRSEKIHRQNEKMKRVPTHPLHQKLKEQTKNRLKRQSINHITKTIVNRFPDILPTQEEHVENLKDYEEWENANINIKLEVTGVTKKEEYTEAALKALTLETLNGRYPADTWARVYTDGSAKDAVKDGGAGIHMQFPDGQRMSKSIPTGKISTNFRAEAFALIEATRTLNTTEQLPNNTVILTDCRSMLQSIQGSKDRSQLMEDIRRELTTLSSKTNLVLQWLPSHCGVLGNEEADRLSKEGSKKVQDDQPVSYAEAKTIIKTCHRKAWKERLGVTAQKDNIDLLNRKQQVTIFRLRTGHCRLLGHLYRLQISHSDECPCGTSSQTPEHILQSCPIFNSQRNEIWNEEVDLNEKLWGTVESLRKTTDFIANTGLDI